MQRFLYILMTIILVVLIVAIITKPGYTESYDKVKTALEAANHKVALYVSHSKQDSGKVYSSIAIRDRIFYREVYFLELGRNRKVAIAAFTKIFLLNPEK